MPHQNVQVGRDVTDADTGEPIITREQAARDRAEWTAQHPPIPGLRWAIYYDINGNVRDRSLQVIPGWEDAYAPAVTVKPTSPRKHDVLTKPSEANRLGALAYQGWFAALPEPVQASRTGWDDVPEGFREPLRQAAVLVWQHAENAGFHEALLRTLPSGRLGAAGALEDLSDFITAVCKLHGGTMAITDILAEIRQRVAQLRRDADAGTRRVKDQRR